MNNTLTRILFFTMFTMHVTGYAQDMDECRQKINDFNSRINNIPVPAKGHAYHFKYTTIYEFRDNRKPLTQNIDIVMGKYQVHYKTNKLEMYQDTAMGFMIDNNSGTIFTFPYIPGFDQEKRLSQIVSLRDSVFELFSIVSCTRPGSDNILKIVFEPGAEWENNKGIERVTYYYNNKTRNTQRKVIEFGYAHQYKKQTIIYETMDLDYAKVPRIPVKQLLMTNDGKLRPQYRNYKLIIKD